MSADRATRTLLCSTGGAVVCSHVVHRHGSRISDGTTFSMSSHAVYMRFMHGDATTSLYCVVYGLHCSLQIAYGFIHVQEFLYILF